MELDFRGIFTEHKEMWGVIGVVGIIMVLMYVHKKTRRISHIEDLPRKCVGMRLSGIVTGVPDGDGFRFFHTPWFRTSRYTSVDSKLYIRLAGIDAPEVRHFHFPEQPFAKESKAYLKKLVLGKKVNIKIVGIDRYNRVLAVVHVFGWFFKTNVNLEMVKNGYACVYVGKDAAYDKYEKTLRELEEEAVNKRNGLWKFEDVMTPMEYKRMQRERRRT